MSFPATDAAPSPPVGWAKNATLFLAGQSVSLFGSTVVQFAVMWFITLETRSGLALGLYVLFAFGPQGVMSIFGGVLADRLNRKRLIIAADATIAVATLALALLMTAGIDSLWVIYLAVAIRSVGAGVQAPTVQALIPEIVPADQLMRVNGIFQTASSAMALLSPAVGAVIYTSFGIIPTFYLDVATACVGIGLLILVTVPGARGAVATESTFRADLAAGIRYIVRAPMIRWLISVLALLFILAQAPAAVLSPLLIAEVFGTEPWMLAAAQVFVSLGTMLGGVLVATLLAKRSRIRLLLASAYAIGVFTVALGLSPELWVYYLFTFLAGLAIPAFSAPFITILQQTVAPEMLGRVFSYVTIAMTLSTPFGVMVFGPLADVFSIQTLLIVSGALLVGVVTVSVLLPSGRATIHAARSAERAALPAREG
ncbi:MFS transporter [Leucobacter komagatae]|uniref:MFS transporter n=1 Tax=Leucobacter komagatae TaxID=55969 RepID=UPI0005ACF8EC|nr:MFS transporter [Leucobacter komagatae]